MKHQVTTSIKSIFAFIFAFFLLAPTLANANTYSMQSNAQKVEILLQYAKAGDANAQASLSQIYYFDKSIPSHYAMAHNWAKASADQNNPRGQHMLGLMYKFGNYVPRDLNKSHELFLKAARAGYEKSMFQVLKDYQKGEGTRQDYAKAYYWIKKLENSADSKMAKYANYGLGLMYLYGNGVAKDINVAKKYFSKACDMGQSRGCSMYNKINGSSGERAQNYKYNNAKTQYDSYAPNSSIQKTNQPESMGTMSTFNTNIYNELDINLDSFGFDE